MGIFLMMRLFPSAKARLENAINRIRKNRRFMFDMKVPRLPMVVMCPFQFMNRPLESNLTCEPEIYLNVPRGCRTRLCFCGPVFVIWWEWKERGTRVGSSSLFAAQSHSSFHESRIDGILEGAMKGIP